MYKKKQTDLAKNIANLSVIFLIDYGIKYYMSIYIKNLQNILIFMLIRDILIAIFVIYIKIKMNLIGQCIHKYTFKERRYKTIK